MKSANHSEPLQQCFKDPGSWKFPKLFDNRFKFSVNLLRYVASLHRASMVALQSPISFACGFLPDVSIGLKSVQQAFHIYLLFERAFRLQMHTHTTECAQSKKEKNYTCTVIRWAGGEKKLIELNATAWCIRQKSECDRIHSFHKHCFSFIRVNILGQCVVQQTVTIPITNLFSHFCFSFPLLFITCTQYHRITVQQRNEHQTDNATTWCTIMPW